MKRRNFLQALLAGSATALIASMAGPAQLGAARVKIIDPKWVKKGLPWEGQVPYWSLVLARDEAVGGGHDDYITPLSITEDLELAAGDLVHYQGHVWQVLTSQAITSVWESVPAGAAALAGSLMAWAL
jgi:hypothetical protein